MTRDEAHRANVFIALMIGAIFGAFGGALRRSGSRLWPPTLLPLVKLFWMQYSGRQE